MRLTLLDQVIPLSDRTRNTIRGTFNWVMAAMGLSLLGWVFLRADHLTTREKARDAKAQAQVEVDRTTNFGRMIVDGDGKIISWNRGMSEATGWKADRMIGRNVSTILAPGWEATPVGSALLTGGAAEGNLSLRRAGDPGATVLIRVHINTASQFRYVVADGVAQLNTL